MSKHRFAVLVLVVSALLVLTFAARAQGQTASYEDDFEGYDVGEHPAVWGEIWGNADEVVTDEWSAGGDKSLLSESPHGSWIDRPLIRLADVGAWPPPDHFFYEATLHMEATPYSSGFVGFPFKDPRYGNQVPVRNAVDFSLNGNITWAGAGFVLLGTWPQGTECTYTVRVEIDFPSETADVWIDGVLVGDDLPAFPKVIPASSVFGSEVPLDKWGFGLGSNWWGGGGPGRVFIDDISLGECSPVLAAEVDINPDTLNLRSRGRFITAYIELPEGYDPADIDVEMVYFAVDDSEDFVPAERRPTAVRDHDRDGVDDLMVKFDRQAVQELLSAGEEVTLYVGGQLADGTEFLGQGVVRVIDTDAIDFFRRSAEANRAFAANQQKVYRALTRRSPGGALLRGGVRHCLRLIDNLLQMSVAPDLMAAMEAVHGAVEDLAEAFPERIDPREVALYGQARYLSSLFEMLGEYFREEARVWQRARSVRRPLDREAVGDWLDAESAQLGLLSESLDSFRSLAAGLGDPDQVQALLDLADGTEAVVTSLVDYVSTLKAQVDSW